MIRVQIYGKADCGLCDEAKAVLHRVRSEIPFELEEIDVETDEALRARYGLEIPVVMIDGRKAFKARVDEATLRARLKRAAR
jgi:glutaredoxin